MLIMLARAGFRPCVATDFKLEVLSVHGHRCKMANLVVGEDNNRMVVYLDEFCSKYEEKSNFVVSITREIRAGSKSGSLCRVTYFTGEPLG